jgi:hypothetical protein
MPFIRRWSATILLFSALCAGEQAPSSATPQPKVLPVSTSGFPVEVLVQSPADTDADLQIICLFHSGPANALHGSLAGIDQKLGGLLTRLRKDSLFAGNLGETLLITPKRGTIPARRLLLIGLGDLRSFSTDREQLVGFIAFEEAARLRVDHPFFAPTVLDGGKTGIDTGDVARQFLRGFLRAKASEDLLRSAGTSSGSGPGRLSFLAGAEYAARTRDSLAQAFQTPGQH